MNWITPETLPLLLTGAAMCALAVWLVVLDARNVANRVFGAFLLARGVTFIAPSLAETVEGTTYGFWHAVSPIAVMVLVPLVLYFVSVFPTPHPRFGTRKAGVLWTLFAVAAVAWYLVDPSSYATVEVANGRPETAGAGFTNVAYGPLSLLSALRLPAMAFAAVRFAQAYGQNPHGSAGYSTFLMFAGFGWNALFDAINTAGNLGLILPLRDTLMVDGFAVAFFVLPILTAPLVIVAMALISRAQRHEKDDDSLQEARRFILFAAPLPVLLALGTHVDAITRWLGNNNLFLIGLTRLVLPLLVSYALLRFTLFDTDLRMKAGLRKAIMAATFAVVFIGISEAMEALVFANQGRVFAVVATIVMALFIRPLQIMAERATNRIMPDTMPIDQMSLERREAFYCDQFKLVHLDNQVTAKERRMLTALAGRLGLSSQRAAELEQHPLDTAVVPRNADTQTSRTPTLYRFQEGFVTIAFVVLLALVGSWLEGQFSIGDFAGAVFVAAGITLLLDPLQGLVTFIFHGPQRPVIANVEQYQLAVAEALGDGRLSKRERIYLQGLAENLDLKPTVRRQLDALALSKRGLAVPWRLRIRLVLHKPLPDLAH